MSKPSGADTRAMTPTPKLPHPKHLTPKQRLACLTLDIAVKAAQDATKAERDYRASLVSKNAS
jgi:hypothetical protein